MTITVQYEQVRVLSNLGVALMFLAAVSIIVLYVLSMLHAADKVDLFKHCKKQPLTPEELARLKYRNEI